MFITLCLDAIPEFNAKDIKRIREHAHVGQAVFAYLNTSESTVQKWETGQNRPGGMALRLLSVSENTWLMCWCNRESHMLFCCLPSV